MANHTSGRAEQSAFAFRLARERTGIVTPSYRPEGSRKALMQTEDFLLAMQHCTMRVKSMGVGYVEIADSVTQHLFEVYCALALKTPYNEFKTT
jgi:hypothetical protein